MKKGFIRVLEYIGTPEAIEEALEKRYVKGEYNPNKGLMIREVVLLDTIVASPLPEPIDGK